MAAWNGDRKVTCPVCRATVEVSIKMQRSPVSEVGTVRINLHAEHQHDCPGPGGGGERIEAVA